MMDITFTEYLSTFSGWAIVTMAICYPLLLGLLILGLKQLIEDGEVAIIGVVLGSILVNILLHFYTVNDYERQLTNIMAANTEKVYTSSELYEEYNIIKDEGLYRIDSSKMSKSLYLKIKNNGDNPYDFVVVRVNENEE